MKKASELESGDIFRSKDGELWIVTEVKERASILPGAPAVLDVMVENYVPQRHFYLDADTEMDIQI